MAMTIAQLVAIVSADTTSLDNRLSKVETDMKKTQLAMEKSAEAMNAAFSKGAAESNRAIEETTRQAQRGAQNLNQYEYQMGKKSVAEYKEFLEQRLSAYEAYTAEWKSAATQMVSLERSLSAQRARDDAELNRMIAQEKKEADAERIASERQYQQEIAALILEEENAVRAAEAAKAKARKEAEIAIDQQKTALANLAKFEYDSGNLSAEAYKVFLQRRMGAFGEYTSEWKSAANQLVSMEREQLSEREAANREYEQTITAQVKEAVADRIAIEREMTAMLAEEQEKRIVDNKKAVSEYVAQQQESAAAVALAWRSVGSGAGNVAAGIAGVEGVTAGMYAGFEAKTTSVANNTLMTNAQMEQMKKSVLETGKATGAQLNDISDGYMRIANHAYQGTEAQKILTVASKEAISTNSKVDSTANALAGTMHVFHQSGDEAANTMNVISIAAARGNSTMQEWTDNTGKATGMAANYGVKLTDVEAALSALTQQKFTTSEANTQVTNLLNHIANPTAEARKNIELLEGRANSMGVSLVKDFSSAGLAGKDLYGVLSDIKLVTGGNSEAVNSLIGAMRGGIGAMALMKSGSKDYHDAFVMTTNASKGVSDTTVDSRFNRSMETGQAQWNKLIRTIEVDFMPVGERAMKLFITWEPTIKELANDVLHGMEAFQRLSPSVQNAVTIFGTLTIVSKLGIDFLRFLGATVKVTDGARFLIKALGPNEGLLWAFRGAAGAGTGFGASLTELSMAGAGPIAIAVIAIAALALELHNLKNSYDEMTDAQNQALASTVDFANAQKEVAAKGEKGALEVNMGQIAVTRDQLKDKLAEGIAPAGGLFNPPGMIQGFANPDGTWMSQSASKKYADTLRQQIAKLNSDYDVEHARLHILDQTGTGVNATNPVGKAGPLGEAVAKAADKYTTATASLSGKCEVLAETIRHNSNVHLNAIEHKGSAKADAIAMANAGLMQAFTPGMAVKPGDQIYSTTLGNDGTWGHVETVNSAGKYVDQHGVTDSPRYGASNYQYLYDPDYAQKGNGGIPFMPPTTNGVSHADMAAMAAKLKAEKEAEKAAEAARKAAQRGYKDEMQSLNMVIALKKKKEDLDTNSETDQANQLLSSGGKLSLITNPKQREALIKKAAETDVAEHKVYIQSLIDKMNDEVAVASLPYLEQRAIQTIGGLDKWKALHTIGKVDTKSGYSSSQQLYMKAIQTTADKEARFSAIKNLKDLEFEEKIAGDAIKKAAVEAEGGAEKWQLLDDATKRVAISTQRAIAAIISQTASHKFLATQIRDVDVKWREFAEQNDDRYFTDAGILAVEKWKQANFEAIDAVLKKGTMAEKARLVVIEARVKAEGNAEQRDKQNKSFNEALSGVSNSNSHLNTSLSDHYDPVSGAVNSWAVDNMASYEKEYGQRAPAMIRYMEREVALLARKNELIKNQQSLNDTADGLNKRGIDVMSATPEAAYENKYKEYDVTTNSYQLPPGMDKTKIDQQFNFTSKLDMVQKLAEGIDQSITSAFDNAFEHGPKHFFTNLIQGFEKTLQQIGIQILNSYLTRFLTSKIGGLAGLGSGQGAGLGLDLGLSGGGYSSNATSSGGSGGGSLIPAITSLFGAGLGMLGAKAATAAVAPSLAQAVMGPIIPAMPFANGGDYSAGVPRITSESGPEIDIPNTGGTIISQREIKQWMNNMDNNGSGGDHYHVHIHGGAIDEQTKRAASTTIREWGSAHARAQARKK